MKWSLLVASLALGTGASAQREPADRSQLTGYIAQIRIFAAQEGGKLWPGFETAPFDFLLIEDGKETLYCRNPLPDGFTVVEMDRATGCNTGVKSKSQLPPNLLAAMPIFGPPSTIVMGTPASTGRSDADWTRTILHEHFHQWQSALPGYYSRTTALGLAGGDQTGMWMLNFPFPYDDAATGRRYRDASISLAKALESRGSRRFGRALRDYLDRRGRFAAQVGQRNWRYLELQLWQEGVARWTEIELGKRFGDPAVRRSARALERKTLAQLRTPDLAGQSRELAYPIGAGEAMLLEACDPKWRRRYPSLLALGPLIEAARKRCG